MNAVPVNHVAWLVVASALNPIADGVNVIHVTAHPRLCMNKCLPVVEYHGYKAPEVSYETWKLELERFVSAGSGEHARSGDESFGHGISRDEIGRYLGYLAKIGFIGLPSEKGRPLLEIHVDAQAVGGRRGAT
ncbi:hypothetical protein EV127DRAFT_470592 [Xylaria flabelliformis]|nr:hypothetical protein EV127DRAFT_470592 [Xylaria flabelliformis]